VRAGPNDFLPTDVPSLGSWSRDFFTSPAVLVGSLKEEMEGGLDGIRSMEYGVLCIYTSYGTALMSNKVVGCQAANPGHNGKETASGP
jgi:hypothetical protein